MKDLKGVTGIDAGGLDHDKAKVNWNEVVVAVHQYEVKKKDGGGDPYKSTFCLRTPSGGCGNKWCDCGVDAPTKCMKQHTQIYRLKQLRKPVNFKMVLCGQMGAPGRLKPPPADGDIEFKLHPLAAQQVQASLSTLPWEGNAGEGGGIDSDSDDAEPATDGQEGESEVGSGDDDAEPAADAEYEVEREYDAIIINGGEANGGEGAGGAGDDHAEGGGGGGSSGGGGGAGGGKERQQQKQAPGYRRPTVVHLWSDGCAAQLKCRWQIEWLLNHGIEGVRIIHNFFQSCHGKGPSDSEGAAVKNHARHQEMRNEKEMNTTEQLVDDCIEHLQIDRLGPVPDFGDDD